MFVEDQRNKCPIRVHSGVSAKGVVSSWNFCSEGEHLPAETPMVLNFGWDAHEKLTDFLGSPCI